MTELQKVEFELLKEFVRICDTLNLKYYLVCGSALGAVKYGGFIPWDDDIDVALPRADYEVFLSKAQSMLPEGIFVQNYRTDKAYPGLGSKLRNSSTTFIEKEASRIPMNHGIFIDIFPLDGCPEDKKAQKAFDRKRYYYYRRRYTRLVPPIHRDLGLTVYSLLYRFFGLYGETQWAVEGMDRLVSSVPLHESKMWCNFANSMSVSDRSPRAYYGEGVMMKFEGLDVRVPEKYDDYLRQKYGDYHIDPPEARQAASHGYIVDVNRPYTEYING